MGPLAVHMSVHILLMTFLAPLAAAFGARLWRAGRETAPGVLGFATFAQFAALWVWHAPPLLDRALASPPLQMVMHGSLFLTAFLFWCAILGCRGERRWRSIAALLVTSKLYCLFAVLLVFAPRALYPAVAGAHAGHGDGGLAATMADQQLAGLLMLVACPATYLLAGIAIAARWLFAMGDTALDRPNTG